ncbi:hypothetical protein NQ315_000462 [Exocentrus adspersus]|uniref:Uncharacterized protein n=1 Tax=Exocentrus adspersus TaxID=1586481 RepID=A0AAV8VEG7_9CUCU|nr:hypothetical protein NQ315_000462 [Exocentrus adspersus]
MCNGCQNARPDLLIGSDQSEPIRLRLTSNTKGLQNYRQEGREFSDVNCALLNCYCYCSRLLSVDAAIPKILSCYINVIAMSVK